MSAFGPYFEDRLRGQFRRDPILAQGVSPEEREALIRGVVCMNSKLPSPTKAALAAGGISAAVACFMGKSPVKYGVTAGIIALIGTTMFDAGAIGAYTMGFGQGRSLDEEEEP